MSAFEQAICQRHIVHMGQPTLVQAVSNCEKRAIGSNGGFGYKSLNEESKKLAECCKLLNMSESEVLRKGIDELYKKLTQG